MIALPFHSDQARSLKHLEMLGDGGPGTGVAGGDFTSCHFTTHMLKGHQDLSSGPVAQGLKAGIQVIDPLPINFSSARPLAHAMG